MRQPDQPLPDNPFPGLRPFREDEEHLFFGRESQVDTMVDKLAAARFLSVVGASGSGKSSLVNCGLRPALHRGLMSRAGTSWAIAQFRPGGNPLRSMARALARDLVRFRGYHREGLSLEEIVETTLRMSSLGLVDIYEQSQTGGRVNLLIIADQFEEMFRYRAAATAPGAGEQERAQEALAFVNLLLAAKALAEFPIYVALTMRSDFLGDCAQFPGLPEAINQGQYLVPRMTREERRMAITGPAAVRGGKISPVLLTRLVNDVGDNPDQLSILQHALNRTWSKWQQRRAGDPAFQGAQGAAGLQVPAKGQGVFADRDEGEQADSRISVSDYRAIGTMAHALNQHAEEAYQELTNRRQKDICEKMFKALTDRGTDARGVRRPTTLGALCALTGAEQDEVIGVIEVFREPSRSFLMPPSPEPLEMDTVIDISHESLMRVWERLKVWTEEEAESARLYRRLSETAALHSAGKAGPWRDPDLQIAVDWREKERPVAAWGERYHPGFDSAMSFLAASEALRQQEIRENQERQWRDVEYEKAMALADEQKLRLAVQRKSARRLLVSSIALGLMFVVAVWMSIRARQQTAEAEVARQQAERETQLKNKALWAITDVTATAQSALNVLSELPAQQVEAAAERSGATLPRVYMQIVNEADRDYATELQNRLRQAGFLVLGIELVPKAAGLRTSEVRYYKKAEEDTAKDILRVLQKEDTLAKLTYLNLENSTKVRPNHFEVWISRRNRAE